MHVQVAVRHDTADGRIRRFIETELTRVREKYSPISADVVVDHEGSTGRRKTVEINVKVPGELIHVREATDDIHTSVEVAVRTLEKKLQRFKERHVRTSNRKRELASESAEDE